MTGKELQTTPDEMVLLLLHFNGIHRSTLFQKLSKLKIQLYFLPFIIHCLLNVCSIKRLFKPKKRKTKKRQNTMIEKKKI